MLIYYNYCIQQIFILFLVPLFLTAQAWQREQLLKVPFQAWFWLVLHNENEQSKTPVNQLGQVFVS